MSSRLFKFFNGTQWLVSFYLTAAIVPLCVSLGLLLIDASQWMEKFNLDKEFFLTQSDVKDLNMLQQYNLVTSKISVPQSEATFLYAMWLVINIPCVGFGAYRGFKAEKIPVNVRTTRIERDIPEYTNIPCHAQVWFTLLVGSLLTSLCVVSEVYYIVTSIWRHSY